jgi:hypothetical protein
MGSHSEHGPVVVVVPARIPDADIPIHLGTTVVGVIRTAPLRDAIRNALAPHEELSEIEKEIALRSLLGDLSTGFPDPFSALLAHLIDDQVLYRRRALSDRDWLRYLQDHGWKGLEREGNRRLLRQLVADGGAKTRRDALRLIKQLAGARAHGNRFRFTPSDRRMQVANLKREILQTIRILKKSEPQTTSRFKLGRLIEESSLDLSSYEESQRRTAIDMIARDMFKTRPADVASRAVSILTGLSFRRVRAKRVR